MSRFFKEPCHILFPNLLSQPSPSERFSKERALIAPLGFFLSARAKEIASQTLYGDRQPFCVDGAFFCAPLGRERGPANDLVRAQEGRSKYDAPFKLLTITPSAPLSTLLFELLMI